MENLGHAAASPRHGQPVLQVLAEVVAEEWTHGERVVHHHFALKSKKILLIVLFVLSGIKLLTRYIFFHKTRQQKLVSND